MKITNFANRIKMLVMEIAYGFRGISVFNFRY